MTTPNDTSEQCIDPQVARRRSGDDADEQGRAQRKATGLSVAWELRVHPDTLTAAERRRREASPDCHGRICRGDPCTEADR